jgi:hypothetical protein
VGFEMRLAHAIKVALSLFGATNDLAHARLGAMTLAETLRLDDVSAARSAAVTTLVLAFLVDPWGRGGGGGTIADYNTGGRGAFNGGGATHLHLHLHDRDQQSAVTFIALTVHGFVWESLMVLDLLAFGRSNLHDILVVLH